MSEEPNQREIVAGLREGSRDAWNALCQQYSSRVWCYVARLIGSDQQAVADCYQETLLAVAKAGRTIAAETHLWSWLATIAHNQAALYWRKQYQTTTEAVPLDSLANRRAMQPADLMAQGELVTAVRKLLAEMQPDQVALLTAKYLDGQSIAHMVEQFGGTTEAMRSRLARARREFRRRYEQLTPENNAPVSKPARTNLSPQGD